MAFSSQQAASASTRTPPPACARGRYRGVTKTEDDVAVIALKCPLLPDDVGDSIGTAKPLPQLPTSFQGLVGFGGDADVFSFQAGRGARVTVTLSLVAPYSYRDSSGGGAADLAAGEARSNLDAEVSLLNSTGQVMQTWTNNAGLLSGALSPGSVSLSYRVGCWAACVI